MLSDKISYTFHKDLLRVQEIRSGNMKEEFASFREVGYERNEHIWRQVECMVDCVQALIKN